MAVTDMDNIGRGDLEGIRLHISFGYFKIEISDHPWSMQVEIIIGQLEILVFFICLFIHYLSIVTLVNKIQ